MENKTRYAALDIMQFICAIMVVIVHVGTITDKPFHHFFIKSMVCRVAVPLYFITSAYFYRKKMIRSSEKAQKWISNFTKKYLVLSIVYLPFGFCWLTQKLYLELWKIPIALIIGLFYSGVFYHLWYFPALLLSLFLGSKLIKSLGYKSSFLIAIILYFVGSGETYYGYLKDTFLETVYRPFFSVFITTKNGLFFGIIFVLIGFYISDTQNKLPLLKKYKKRIVVSVVVIWVMEGTIIYQNQGLDKNFLLSLIPLGTIIFSTLLKIKGSLKYSQKFQKIGQSIYFFHMIPIEIFNFLIRDYKDLAASKLGIIRLIIGLICPLIYFLITDKASICKKQLRYPDANRCL
ncbi:hypothetical protein ATZ33_07425 [Enterococcus silesiacus]|uniref:Acyltransferase 3 domain-containing protein n=1 Tax=Enterococcus silesiacus TaxID=332949 RepID=A0A0S3KA94_9ENTE|nr:acyltransferase family protein [Enterococcus silesiacus]ALS01203.1 hypothetical protein ATZ33_07425 [Enterococcus silesiacus]OJG92603.1 hypothetical protein RV15_GL003028 [Enterococcus silesiacus]